MFTASFVLTALAIAVVIGGGLSAYLWRSRRKQLVIAAGIRALAGMRWREFSRFVIEALQAQGFEANRGDAKANAGQPSDLLLTRGGQTWLLSCKQGANQRIAAPQVTELASTIRRSGAAGGILATLGRIEPDARKQHHGIELLDGAALWPLIDPLLPPSLHQHLAAQARSASVRELGVTWMGALAIGALVAFGLSSFAPASSSAAAEPALAISTPLTSPTVLAGSQSTQPAPSALPAPSTAPVAASLSEDEQRKQVMEVVSTLPGVERAAWSTRSTLLVNLSEEVDDPRVAGICQVLKRFDDLRTSRLQLQPPAGSAAAVRFLQCYTF